VILVLAVVLIVAPLTVTRTRRGRTRTRPSGRAGLPGGGTRSPDVRDRPAEPTPTTRPPAGRPSRPVTPGRPPATRPAPGPEAPPEPAPGAPDAVAAPPETVGGQDAEAAVALAPLVRPRFRDRLTKARALFSGLLARTTIDQDTWDELEEALIRADVGVKLTSSLLDDLRARVRAEGLTTADSLVEALKADLKKTLASGDRGLRLDPGETNVWLFVGVNGVGKTTTIGKLGHRYTAEGHRVVMAAGDTFRAAAAEQLQLWSERAGADLVRGAEGSDPGAVIFDAVQRAASRGADLVLGDTAGRLHTKVNLMEELKKVRRVAERPPGHLTEVLLVIDATTGQNGLTQARQFLDAVDVSGVVLTKLDGTAKGGIALAIQAELGIPIKLVGLGEGADDLTEFDPDEFVDALLAA